MSYGVAHQGKRYFVKTAGEPDDSRPLLSHAARVTLLRNAARLSTVSRHPILARLYQVIESEWGPLLVYEWRDGELLYVRRYQRNDPASAFQRFRQLSPVTICDCLDAIFDLHAELAHAGWIAADFYDGCLIYDFVAERMAVVDLDAYKDAPFVNTMGRMFGSTRFMAPEEFALGATIDERTNVFVMGRTALVFLSDGTHDPDAFVGPPSLFEVAARACEQDRSRRFDSMATFWRAWRTARGSSGAVVRSHSETS